MTDEELAAYESTAVWEDGEPCLSEALMKKWGLLPVPDWMRKPPRRKKNQPGLFDDE